MSCMEPITNASHHLVTRAVTLELLGEEGDSRPVPTELNYDRNDPFAVSLLFSHVDPPVAWTFARELLSDGLYEPSGDGDVHVWPCVNDQERLILLIELSTHDGEALLQASRSEIMVFLAMSHDVVAPGEESAHIDIDAVIEAIFAAEPVQS